MILKKRSKSIKELSTFRIDPVSVIQNLKFPKNHQGSTLLPIPAIC